MPFVSGPICRDAAINVESSTKVTAKPREVDTWTRYVVAPLVAFQVNVVVTGIPLAPSAGVASVGIEGAATIVVKL